MTLSETFSDLPTLHIDEDVSRASTLSDRWYTDPQALTLERSRIFDSTWQYATALHHLKEPGDYVATEIVGRPIVVVRDQQGVLRGYYNVCRHRAGPVAEGSGRCQVLRCAYHGWTYGLDGQLRLTPEMKGASCFDKANFGLRPIQVQTFGPFVFVRLKEQEPSLSTCLGKIPEETAALPLDRMRPFRTLRYEIDCNWKVYVDNYLEGYHIPIVHPGLLKELSYPDYRVETERYYSKQIAPVRNPDNKLYRRHLPENAEPTALYYWVFPNLMLNIYPDNIQLNIILPLGHDRTATVFEWYLLDPERPTAEADFAESLAFSDMIQKEDIAICEHVQKGLNSGAYGAGRFVPNREGGVHHFHRLYAEFMRSTGGLP